MSTQVLLKMRSLPKLDQQEFLSEYIKSQFKKALHIDVSDDVATDISIFDLGLNSLGVETLRQRFEETLDCQIDSTEIFENPTITHFIHSITSRLLGSGQNVECEKDSHEMHDMVNAMLSRMYTPSKG